MADKMNFSIRKVILFLNKIGYTFSHKHLSKVVMYRRKFVFSPKLKWQFYALFLNWNRHCTKGISKQIKINSVLGLGELPILSEIDVYMPDV